MVSLLTSQSIHQTGLPNASTQVCVGTIDSEETLLPLSGPSTCLQLQLPFAKAWKTPTPCRRDYNRPMAILLSADSVNVYVIFLNNFAAEAKIKGFLPVTDKKDGYNFLYPFGWQEVIVEGQDKVFKDVIEPLESVSVNLIPTAKQDIRDLGSPQEVAETLIKRVLASPSQKTKLIEATEHEVEGKAYYTIEFIAQAPNYTRHALSAVCIGNGKFYTLTTGANERRWEKMKDRLKTVVDSFQIFNV